MPDSDEHLYAFIVGYFMAIMGSVQTPEELADKFDELKRLETRALGVYAGSKTQELLKARGGDDSPRLL